MPVEPLFSGGFEPGVPGRPLEQAEPLARRCEVRIVASGVMESRQRPPEPGRHPRIDLRDVVFQPVVDLVHPDAGDLKEQLTIGCMSATDVNTSTARSRHVRKFVS